MEEETVHEQNKNPTFPNESYLLIKFLAEGYTMEMNDVSGHHLAEIVSTLVSRYLRPAGIEVDTTEESPDATIN